MLIYPILTHVCFRLVYIQIFCVSRLAFMRFTFHDSHKKQKDSLETRAVLIEIAMLCLNLSSGQNNGNYFRKNMAFSEGNYLFASHSDALQDEINAGMLQFIKK